ncbi:hypothetical protein Dimus_019691 [Dionaea muscipula]
MVSKAWRIIPRPLLETVLNNHVQHHRVPQPLILHGPRGVGKTTLILERLLEKWNKGPHLTGYVDFAEAIKDHHPIHNQSFPCHGSQGHQGNLALRSGVSDKASTSVLWDRAVFAFSGQVDRQEIEGIVGLDEKEKGKGRDKGMSVEERSYFKEALVALKLAKEVIRIQQGWTANAVAHLNRTGGFSRSLANSSTDWSYLLLELLSDAAEIDHFQPKLVMNNIDVLRNAVLTDDSTVCASMYHDSLIWKIIALGANERCLPVILITSDSYYSYRAFIDFGFPDIFVSREVLEWTYPSNWSLKLCESSVLTACLVVYDFFCSILFVDNTSGLSSILRGTPLPRDGLIDNLCLELYVLQNYVELNNLDYEKPMLLKVLKFSEIHLNQG